MKKKLVLFDLDGTLLPMDQDEYTKAYFMVLLKKLAGFGLPAQTPEEQKALGKAVWSGTYAMLQNDGTCTNEERFFSVFNALTGVDLSHKKAELEVFYQNEFNQVSVVSSKNPLIPQVLERLKANGYRVAIATNPLFPLAANGSRLAWAGLSLEDFEYCTCYENSRYCKPNLDYYRDILNHLGVSAEECIMVGNDVNDDMVVRELGMDVFLVTDCLINADNKDINDYPHGSFADFVEFMGI